MSSVATPLTGGEVRALDGCPADSAAQASRPACATVSASELLAREHDAARDAMQALMAALRQQMRATPLPPNVCVRVTDGCDAAAQTPRVEAVIPLAGSARGVAAQVACIRKAVAPITAATKTQLKLPKVEVTQGDRTKWTQRDALAGAGDAPLSAGALDASSRTRRGRGSRRGGARGALGRGAAVDVREPDTKRVDPEITSPMDALPGDTPGRSTPSTTAANSSSKSVLSVSDSAASAVWDASPLSDASNMQRAVVADSSSDAHMSPAAAGSSGNGASADTTTLLAPFGASQNDELPSAEVLRSEEREGGTDATALSVVVSGSNIDDVTEAVHRVLAVCGSGGEAQQLTHFFSFPIEGAASAFEAWKADVLATAPATANIDAKSFVPSPSLHVTLGLLSCRGVEHVADAARVLADAQPAIRAILEPHMLAGVRDGRRGVPIAMRELRVMDGKIHAARVVYTPLHHLEPALKRVWATIMTGCVRAGLVTYAGLAKQHNVPTPGGDNVSFIPHCTLLKLRAPARRGGPGAAARPAFMNVTHLMERFNAPTALPAACDAASSGGAAPLLFTGSGHSVHLSVLGPRAATGYYQAAAVCSLADEPSVPPSPAASGTVEGAAADMRDTP